MPVSTETNNLGDLLKYEAPNLYSRERVTVGAGQNLALGTVLGVVTATGKAKALDPTATDGSETAAGVLAIDCDATLVDRDDALSIARHAIVSDVALVWPAGITPEQKAAAQAELKRLGVLIRKGV